MEIEFNEKLAFLFKPARLKITYGGRGAIYGILNLLNGKIYIGSAVNFKARFRQHKSELRSNKHKNNYLQSAWNKYGEEIFEFLVLEIVDNKNDLLDREQTWINLTNCYNDNCGYNILPNARNSLGVKRSDETKLKISKVNKGKVRSDEFKNKISKAVKGKKHTKEAIDNMIEAQKKNDKRKLDKWPHELGIKCRCADCKEKKRIYTANRRAAINARN